MEILEMTRKISLDKFSQMCYSNTSPKRRVFFSKIVKLKGDKND